MGLITLMVALLVLALLSVAHIDRGDQPNPDVMNAPVSAQVVRQAERLKFEQPVNQMLRVYHVKHDHYPEMLDQLEGFSTLAERLPVGTRLDYDHQSGTVRLVQS